MAHDELVAEISLLSEDAQDDLRQQLTEERKVRFSSNFVQFRGFILCILAILIGSLFGWTLALRRGGSQRSAVERADLVRFPSFSFHLYI